MHLCNWQHSAWWLAGWLLLAHACATVWIAEFICAPESSWVGYTSFKISYTLSRYDGLVQSATLISQERSSCWCMFNFYFYFFGIGLRFPGGHAQKNDIFAIQFTSRDQHGHDRFRKSGEQNREGWTKPAMQLIHTHTHATLVWFFWLSSGVGDKGPVTAMGNV